MSQSINWDLLEDQYLSDGVYREKLSKMVTIVDEAFLAGKKFAQTYSQKDEGPDAKIVKPTIPVLNKKDNLDITYKESIGAHLTAQNIIDVTKKVEDMNTTVPHNAIKVDAIAQIEKLYVELKKLLDEGKISQTLYHKLTSNEKFKLHAEDIEDINKLNQEDVKELILRYKIGECFMFYQ